LRGNHHECPHQDWVDQVIELTYFFY